MLADLLIMGAIIGFGVALIGWLRASQRAHEVRLEAGHHGLSEASIRLIIQILGRDGSDTARALLRSPELMRQRLAAELASFKRHDPAARFAENAARLAEELRLSEPPVEAAPRLFETIKLSDATDLGTTSIVGYVVDVDEGNITFASPDSCPWPVRRDLLASRPEEDSEPFVVTLLLRPMPGAREWVVNHELVMEGNNRRSARRVPCHIRTWALPTTAGTYALRGRLQAGEALETEAVHRLPAWERRRAVVVEDLSSEGARLSLDGEVSRGDRFYVVLPGAGDGITALPLAEVVSIRSGDDGQAIIGARFCAVRLKERMIIADYARDAARTVTMASGRTSKTQAS